MMTNAMQPIRVLTIDPTTSGFGFVVMESPDLLIDWGVREVAGDKLLSCLKSAGNLMDRYSPNMIVVESPVAGKCRRCERVRELIGRIINLAAEQKIRTRVISRAQVRDAFSKKHARNKHEIAMAIANELPELAPRLPKFRQPWMPEDVRMAIFDAAAMALTLYELNSRRQKSRLSTLGINNDVETEETRSGN